MIKQEEDLEYEEKPKNFGELLALKLDKMLPDEKEFFTRKELESFTSGILGSKETLNSHVGITFSRKNSIEILQSVLTTRIRVKSTPKESYDRNLLLRTFRELKADSLNEWSSKIRHDWEETPEVIFTEAMQIRGLSMLGRLKLPPKT